MTNIQIIRREIETGHESLVAGYSRINLSTAVQFLDHEANQYGKANVRTNDFVRDGKQHFQRILTENGEDVAMLFLRFIERVDEFKNEAQEHIDALRELINQQLSHDGDTEETSQRICLLNALNNFECCVSGVEDSDFDEEL